MKKISWVQLCFTFVGVFLGAGFVSGQELWKFFACFGAAGLAGFLVSAGIMTAAHGALLGLVRSTGLEPVRQRHTPLKRACLPIPAHSHMQYWVDRDRLNAVYYSIDRQESQALFDRFGENIPLLP